MTTLTRFRTTFTFFQLFLSSQDSLGSIRGTGLIFLNSLDSIVGRPRVKGLGYESTFQMPRCKVDAFLPCPANMTSLPNWAAMLVNLQTKRRLAKTKISFSPE